MRNRFEAKVSALLGPRFQYEATKFPYVRHCTYLPDWIDPVRKIMCECKGHWRDRTKMVLVRKAYPDWRIIMVFYDPDRKISKGSKTTYRQWSLDHGLEVMTPEQLKSID